MYRLLKNITLVGIVAVLITAGFFLTRGCGFLNMADYHLPSELEKLGSYPILAKKGNSLTFYPIVKGLNFDKYSLDDLVDELTANIEKQVCSVLDTILYLNMIERVEIQDLIDRSIADRLVENGWERISDWKNLQGVSVDLGAFIRRHSQYLREDFSKSLDSLINQLPDGHLESMGNY